MKIEAPYTAAVGFRNFLYDKGVLKSYLTPPLIVSIGNIEAGGTGKTPFTMALAGELKALGRDVAIITRGYRGRLSGPVEVNQSHDCRDVGDEPLLMARVTGVPVIKSPDRCKGALFACRKFGSRIVILDDGFQHRRIFRDLNICLISGPLEEERMLPMGRLREPVSSLKRADIVINTGKETAIEAEGVINRDWQTLHNLRLGRVFAFCGIANPGRFFDTLRPMCEEMKTFVFMDHHRYGRSDIRRIKKLAAGSDIIITTAKDFVRLRREWLDERFHALKVSIKTDTVKDVLREIERLERDRRISRQG